MGMRKALIRKKQVLEAEMRRREIMAEMDARKQAKTGEPNIIEEQHEDVSWQDRLALKNLGRDANSNAAYIAKNNPQLDTRVWDGRVLVKRKNETDWKTLDPDAEGFDGFGEFAKDVGDVVYDVGAGIIEGVGTAAAGVATMNPLAAVGTNAALGGANEAIRQKLGDVAGLHEGVDMGDVTTTAVLSGAIPLVPGAAMKAAKGAKNTAKGAAKFLTGISEENIQKMQEKGAENLLKLREKTGIATIFNEKSAALASQLDEVQMNQIARVEKLRSQLNIQDDDQLRAVLEAEVERLTRSGAKQSKIRKVVESINDIEDTKQVRKQINDIGFEDPELLRSSAFPDSLSTEDIQNLTPELNNKLQNTLSELRYDYETLGQVGEDVSLENLRKLYGDKIASLRVSGSSVGDRQLADALENDLEKKLAIVVKDQDAGGLTMAKDVIKQRGKTDTFSAVAKIKKVFSDSAYNNQKVTGGIDQVENANALSKMHKQAERVLNDDMIKASEGLKGELDPKYVQINAAIKDAKKLFDDPIKASATIKRVLKGGQRAELEMARIKKIDDIAGTDYAGMINRTVEAESLTKKGIEQAKFLEDSAEEYLSNAASKGKSVEDVLLEGIEKDIRDPKKLEVIAKKYRDKSSTVLNEELDVIDKKYGPKVGKAFKKMVEEIDFIAAFGDPKKTGVDQLSGQSGSLLQRVGQAAAWGSGIGAGPAQVVGMAGKAVGDKLKIREGLRYALPKYMKGKQWAKGLNDDAKRELEKKLFSTLMSRRDAIRQLAKEAGREE